MNLLKAAASVSAMTLLSRISGFIRDWLIAVTFGAGSLTDAFFNDPTGTTMTKLFATRIDAQC